MDRCSAYLLLFLLSPVIVGFGEIGNFVIKILCLYVFVCVKGMCVSVCVKFVFVMPCL